jgi:hypothetical protein
VLSNGRISIFIYVAAFVLVYVAKFLPSLGMLLSSRSPTGDCTTRNYRLARLALYPRR